MNPTEWAKQCFAQDVFATDTTGVCLDTVELDEQHKGGYARCTLNLAACHRNARGAVMGGVLFTMADFAAAVAMNVRESFSNSDNAWTNLHWVSLNSTINFLSQPHTDNLSAEARCIRHGSTTCLYQVEISDGDRLVTIVTTTGIRV